MATVSTSTATLAQMRGNVRAADRESTWSLDTLACWSLVTAVVFINGADFRGGSAEEFTVHWQIYLRLLVAFASGCVGLALLPSRTFKDFITWPGLLVSLYVLWYGATLTTAIDRAYCGAAWASLVGVILMIPAAMRTLGGYRYWTAITTGLTLYVVGSWIAYLFFPDVGVFQEQVTKTDVFERMGGLGHPNELGFYSAYTVLVYLGLATSGRLRWRWAILGIALGAVTLINCFSRTATITCVIGVLFVLQSPLRRPGNIFGILAGLALCASIGFATVGSGKLDWFIAATLTKVTKSGSTEELSTATGRTEIWQEGIGLIRQSPVTGYGYCSARFVMDEFSYHCHNVVLNALMYGGVISGLLVASMLLYQWSNVFISPRPEVDGLIVCMLVGGMVDELIGSASPAASLLIWFSLIFWRQLDMSLLARQPSVLAGQVAPERIESGT